MFSQPVVKVLINTLFRLLMLFPLAERAVFHISTGFNSIPCLFLFLPYGNYINYMKTKTHKNQKRCICCGRFFIPDCRVGGRQKSCKLKKCQKKRKKLSQKSWVEKNQDYFKGRYGNTKQWRKNNPDYQKLWRAKNRKIRSEIQDEIPIKSSLKTIHLVMPDDFFKDKIQDEIRLVRQCGRRFFVAGKKMQDTSPNCIT